MSYRYELFFDDITDEFGNPIPFYVIDYTFDLVQKVDHRANEPVINHPDAHKCILIIVLQYPTNYAMQEWMVSYISESATRKSGTFTSYTEDGSILSQVRFESAECMQLDQKGELEEGRRELTKTMTIRFSTKTLVINGITVFGQLREDRRAGVPVTERETETQGRVTEYYLADAQGNRLEQLEIGSTVYLMIESEGLIGEAVDIPIPNEAVDFAYQGKRLENDTLYQHPITQAVEKVELEVIAPIDPNSITEIPF